MEFEKLFSRQRIQCGCQLILILLFPKPLLGAICFTLPSKRPSGLLFQSTRDFVMSAASAGQSMNMMFFKDTILPFFFNHTKKRKTKPNQQTKNREEGHLSVSLLMFLHGFDFFTGLQI